MIVEGTPPAGIDALSFQVEEFQRLAAALGWEGRGRRVVDEMEAAFASGAEEIARTGLAGAPVALMQFLPGAAQFRVFGDGSLPVEVAEKLTLENAWTHETNEWDFTSVTSPDLIGVREGYLSDIEPSTDRWMSTVSYTNDDFFGQNLLLQAFYRTERLDFHPFPYPQFTGGVLNPAASYHR